MNFLSLSQILKGTWAIDPRSAVAYGSMLKLMFDESNTFEPANRSIKPKCVSAVTGNEAEGLENSSKGDIAVIPVIGPLMKYSEMCGAVGMEEIGSWIRQADADTNIKGIILKFDTPGGTVDGTQALADTIKSTKKPIVAFVSGQMCSAGMWLGSACDEIVASLPLDEVGSIGVMLNFSDMQPYYEAQGVKFHRIYADQSPDKNKVVEEALAGNYDAIKKEMLNPIAEEFISTIRANRPNVKDGQLTGKVFFAKDVVGSLIDYVGAFDFAIERINALAKPNTKTIYLL